MKQISPRIRKEVEALGQPWEIVKKKDHYFLKIGEAPLVCVANNSSRGEKSRLEKNCIARIRKMRNG